LKCGSYCYLETVKVNDTQRISCSNLYEYILFVAKVTPKGVYLHTQLLVHSIFTAGRTKGYSVSFHCTVDTWLILLLKKASCPQPYLQKN